VLRFIDWLSSKTNSCCSTHDVHGGERGTITTNHVQLSGAQYVGIQQSNARFLNDDVQYDYEVIQ
jgi:hypothetical protein